MRRLGFTALAVGLLIGACSAVDETEPSSSTANQTTVPQPGSVTNPVDPGAPSVEVSPTYKTTPPAHPAPFVGRWLETGPDLGGLFVDQRSLIWDGEAFYQMLRVGYGDVRVWRSVDAIEWIELPQLGTASTIDGPRALMASDRGLAAIGNVGTRVLVWEFEGETPWRETPAGFNGIIDSAIDFAGVYLVAGSVPVPGGEGAENGIPILRRGAVWASNDLRHWEEVAVDLFGSALTATEISFGEDGVVVYLTYPVLDQLDQYIIRRATSADGITWRILEEGPWPDHVQLRPDPDVEDMWVVHPEDASPFPRPERAGWGSKFAEWKGVPIVAGTALDLRADPQLRGMSYPAVWSLSSGDRWVEVGPFSQQLTELGQIGRLVIGGDRVAAFGSLYNVEAEQHETIFTFVLESPVDAVIPTWVNNTFLGQVDPVIWTDRMNRACTEGVWDDDVARRLAEEFITEDLSASVRDDGVRPPIDEAAQALWLMAVNYCRADFPAGEIQDGPIGR